ncbi:oxygen-independent coproporphyrinogen III oxidase [Hansschlegelia zhihuaiae]|uniref:Coproporphyrinogen-III oxidase n=1 Tax=Hansschlegelia zhihuaiae TaxID=405005 RepID=A0A4Q0MI13_9HYPH|nr:oxygen-independent coproporphyrinogen III oxidase [Hansschlegelia zhihuaiae]RXF73180.1 oxygen-independent coproporphyrinogen III oxidase [Hansschlegelia zhihuaiae]
MFEIALPDILNRQVPRYTSYPTAPHFSAAVDVGSYARWLSELKDAPGAASLYLHVPFCRSICHYCGCATRASRREEPLVEYARRLRLELDLVASHLGTRAVSHVHWGGGTPSMLPEDAFFGLAAAIHARFDVLATAEHAIELDPRLVGGRLAERLAMVGVNRASLGVQDFDETVQKAIGRRQTVGTVVNAVAQLRRVGVDRLNLDLIYGLPRQTLRSMRATVEQAIALEPDRIALFGYAHVPWQKANQKLIDASALPDAALRLELATIARETLEGAGFVAVGIDHFVRPGDDMAAALQQRGLRRNFQGYTTDDAPILIGLGASSISRLPQGYVQNAPDVGAWSKAIEQGRLPTTRGVALTADDRMRADVIEEIMCYFGVDLAEVTARHNSSPSVFATDVETLEPLRRSGFIRFLGDRLLIMRDAPAIARIVASAFDAHLTETARHSLAA